MTSGILLGITKAEWFKATENRYVKSLENRIVCHWLHTKSENLVKRFLGAMYLSSKISHTQLILIGR